MKKTVSLNGAWDLTWAELIPVENYNSGIKACGRKCLTAQVPEATIVTLQREGLIGDPNYGMNTLSAFWVDNVWWVYHKEFEVSAEDAEKKSILTFSALEYAAEIKLNGEKIGEHANAHRKCEIDLTGKLKIGKNTLVLTLESGVFKHYDYDIAKLSPDYLTKINRRNVMRKPQYQGGWDWNPRLTNVGIIGDVTLEYIDATPAIADIFLQATVSDDLNSAKLMVSVILDNSGSSANVPINIKLPTAGIDKTIEVKVDGKTEITETFEIKNPELWYPRGYGKQPLYTALVTVSGETKTKTIGFRHVELFQDPHPVEGKYFILKINKVPVFFKGGNYVPADTVYSAVTKEHYQKLVDLAVDANFNLLRIWGGAEYAPIDLCEACDRAGIVMWHDFPFACGKYPANELWFLREVRVEVEENVRQRSHFPSIIVWCGNNEIEWGDKEWGYETFGTISPHHALFHDELPRILNKFASDPVYWPSSPYSPDFLPPNSSIVGDQHPWDIALGTLKATDSWRHRTAVDRFPNEGGVLGAIGRKSAYEFLPEHERDIHSLSWDHHDNPFSVIVEDKTKERRCYQTVELWTGIDVNTMSFDDYLFASGLLQAEGLSEYICNYRRRSFSSSCAVFWMYNDSWPASHGWTIVDYYLRKKIPFYPVSRAFNKAFTTPAIDGDTVNIYVQSEVEGEYELECGIFTLTGHFPVRSVKKVTASGESKSEYSFELSKLDTHNRNNCGAYSILRDQEGKIVSQNRMFIARFGELELVANPNIEMKLEGNMLTLTSDTFVWGLCFDLDGDTAIGDNAIDLIPNTPYTMYWDEATMGTPTIQMTGNHLFT